MIRDGHPKRVIVTGGAGFIGSHLSAALVGHGHHVTCIDNLVTGSAHNLIELLGHPRFTFAESDVATALDVDGRIDTIYHLATPLSRLDHVLMPHETIRAGTTGMTNALELARHTRARFVLGSTAEVYADQALSPQHEADLGATDPASPRGTYTEIRRFAEALVSTYRRSYEVDTAIARIFGTYGPRMRLDDGRVVSNLLRDALTGQPLTVSTDAMPRSTCYVDDVVAALVTLGESPFPGPVNIGNPVGVSVLDLARLIATHADSSAGVELTQGPDDSATARVPDITLASELLGWTPRTSMEDGVARTVRWFAARRASR